MNAISPFFLIAVLVLLTTLSTVVSSPRESSRKSTNSIPRKQNPFVLQDPLDGLCLGGSTFKRCGIDTMWYLTGSPGSYQIHRYHQSDDRNDGGSSNDLCFRKSQCCSIESDIEVSSCNHPGAKKWNLYAASENGFALTQNDLKSCMKRLENSVNATIGNCDSGYSSVSLLSVLQSELTLLRSEGAKLISAAYENDIDAVNRYLADGVDVNSRGWNQVTPLIAASSLGFTELVTLLVRTHKANVNSRDRDHVTALIESAASGYTEIVQLLLDSGADFETYSTLGTSPLWIAASGGHEDVVRLLIDKGADASTRTFSNEQTALMESSLKGHTNVVNLLLGAKASVNEEDKELLTALMMAAENGTYSLVESLINYGANVNAVSKTGLSPLILACAHGHYSVVELLINSKADVNFEYPENATPLMYAAAGGAMEIVDLLVKSGANINLKHKSGGSSLSEASNNGSIPIIKYLIDHGADAFVVDNEGVNCLMTAAAQGNVEASKFFISRGLNVNHMTDTGGSALMYAVISGKIEIVQALIDANADVNVGVKPSLAYKEKLAKQNGDGTENEESQKDNATALHMAANEGHTDIVKVLLGSGASVNALDEDGASPLAYAMKRNHTETATELLLMGANPNDFYVDESGRKHNLLLDAISSHNTSLALLLIEQGAKVSCVDEDGVSAILQASHLGNLAIVNALISKQVDLQIHNGEEINPLSAAASEGHIEIVKSILATGKVNVNAIDPDGTNALMVAAIRGHKEVVQVLLAHGIDINTRNVDGHSALMFAYNGKNQVETLLDKYNEYMPSGTGNSTRYIRDSIQTHGDIVSLIIKHSADANIKDKEGRIAVDFDYLKS